MFCQAYLEVKGQKYRLFSKVQTARKSLSLQPSEKPVQTLPDFEIFYNVQRRVSKYKQQILFLLSLSTQN